VRWPGHVKPGSRTNQIGHLIDILPTCLEIAGARPLAVIKGKPTLPLEGRGLAAVLDGGQLPAARELFWEWAGNCAVREGEWKLVWDTLETEQRWRLFNIEADRTELVDLAAQKPDIVARLSGDFMRWAGALERNLPGQKGKNADD
jgi:arylsulfatase